MTNAVNVASLGTAMTATSSGNVGIGTSSPAARVHVSGTTGATSSAYLENTSSAIGNVIGGTYFYSRASSNNWFSGVDAYVPSGSAGVDFTDLRFYTKSAERARIDSSGNLLVGTTTPYAPAGSGQLRVNGFISSSKTGIPGASNNEVIIGGPAGSPTAGRVFFGDNTGWQWDWGYVNSGGTYGVRFRFTDQGSAFNTSGTWGTISDARLKENIVDATPKLDGLLRLRVRNFNFITEPDKKQIGFVAQEVEEIFPGLVDNTKPDADGNSTKAVKTTVLVPMLVKAIQEQQAIITALTARVAALENT